MFCDNAAIHKSVLAKRAFETVGIRLIYNIVRKPLLNCIEKFWLAIKQVYRRHRMQNIIDNKRPSPKNLIRQIIRGVDANIPKKLSAGGLKLWHQIDRDAALNYNFSNAVKQLQLDHRQSVRIQLDVEELGDDSDGGRRTRTVAARQLVSGQRDVDKV